MPDNTAHIIAKACNIQAKQVEAVMTLLADGATIPFIARYRKEATGNLDDIVLRSIAEQLDYLHTLNERKKVILGSLATQNITDAPLLERIHACMHKQTLEDLYLPYKPKRKNKAEAAKALGLLPLAEHLWHNPNANEHDAAQAYVNADVPDVTTALQGARDILAQLWAEDADLLAALRQQFHQHALLLSQAKPDSAQVDVQKKFLDYYDFQQNLADVPSHRLLALLRGQQLNILDLKLVYALADEQALHPLIETMAKHLVIPLHAAWLMMSLRWCFKVKLQLSLEVELLQNAKEEAQKVAMDVFAKNIRDILMQAPAGARTILGLDPGFRTGIKAAVINPQGDILCTHTFFALDERQQARSAEQLLHFIKQFNIDYIGIGNGTASRETDTWVGKTLQTDAEHNVHKMMVNEAGASIYSASEYASQELPDLDVSLRGAVSIARRLQDPLAELVKISPESIGVGQYQHDIPTHALAQKLDAVVEDCVNAVGVDVNRASVALLRRISGLSQHTAQKIVDFRQKNGPFRNRQELKKVPYIGDKTFEQAAGFLRIVDGDVSLDASSVHPESYHVVDQIAQLSGMPLAHMLNKSMQLQPQVKHQLYKSFSPTLIQDILDELEKPARDPRPKLLAPKLKAHVYDIKDVQVGMQLEGKITNVTAFGAFVDIGVHQDGLVHISQVSRQFIKDIQSVLNIGQVVKVDVVGVDVQRKRIELSMLKYTPH